jgi:Tfp pilus assembly protein PilO
MKGQDLFILLAAATTGAVGWQMYKDSKKKTNPDDEMEDHLKTRLQEKLAQLDAPMQQQQQPQRSFDVDAIERRLRKLERRNPRDDYDDRDEYDDD